jgi:hypothetical protein
MLPNNVRANGAVVVEEDGGLEAIARVGRVRRIRRPIYGATGGRR